jgi:hypothetical protein
MPMVLPEACPGVQFFPPGIACHKYTPHFREDNPMTIYALSRPVSAVARTETSLVKFFEVYLNRFFNPISTSSPHFGIRSIEHEIGASI